MSVALFSKTKRMSMNCHRLKSTVSMDKLDVNLLCSNYLQKYGKSSVKFFIKSTKLSTYFSAECFLCFDLTAVTSLFFEVVPDAAFGLVSGSLGALAVVAFAAIGCSSNDG